MSAELPWRELGLSRVRVCVGRDAVLLDEGRSISDSASTDQGKVPVAVYTTAADPSPPDGSVDLRLLARALRPTLPDHEIGSVAASYGLSVTSGRGAAAAAAVLAAMIEDAIGLDRQIVALLARLLSDPLAGLLDRILLLPRPEGTPEEAEAGPADRAPADREGRSAVDVLGSGGAIERTMPAYEERGGQLEMAEAVEEAFRDGEALLVEAGPGTGKTFAYLVPALLRLRDDASTRVVVSTRTKQLQEQLYAKDLPFLRTRLAPDLRVALLKGRENYLCLRRWQAVVAELAGGLERERLALLAPLARWLVESDTGDIDENAAFLGEPEARALWGRLCDAANHCVGVFCPFLDECFSIAARRRARKAQLVVVNHSLLLGDLVVGGVVLGKYMHLIVDEAHSLESVARTAFTRSLSERIVARVAEELVASGRYSGWLRGLGLSTGDGDVGRAAEHVATVRRRSATLFRSLARKLPEDRRGAFSSLSGLEPRIDGMTAALEQLELALDRLGEKIDPEETRKELEGYIDRVSGLGEVAKAIATPPDENTVHWYEREHDGVVLHSTPLDVAPFFQRLLYPRVESVVMTSATLSLAGDFEYVAQSIGLTDGILRVRTRVVDSPFSFRDRMKVAVPSYFAPIDAEGDAYVDGLASLLGTLAARLGRKGLALFTSYQMLRAVRGRIPAEIATFAQGVDGPRSTLIDRFRAHEGPGILLGTESFWEGVDLPGEEMEFLVITRLPFSVPTDPIFSALADRAARSGRDPFRDLALPQAVLKLRQGVGRLIRTRDDHGIVVVTDQRILTRSYGARFVESLPVPLDAYDREVDLIEGVSDWFPAGP